MLLAADVLFGLLLVAPVVLCPELPLDPTEELLPLFEEEFWLLSCAAVPGTPAFGPCVALLPGPLALLLPELWSGLVETVPLLPVVLCDPLLDPIELDGVWLDVLGFVVVLPLPDVIDPLGSPVVLLGCEDVEELPVWPVLDALVPDELVLGELVPELCAHAVNAKNRQHTNATSKDLRISRAPEFQFWGLLLRCAWSSLS